MGFRPVFRPPIKHVVPPTNSELKTINDDNWENLRPGYQATMVKLSDQIKKEVSLSIIILNIQGPTQENTNCWL